MYCTKNPLMILRNERAEVDRNRSMSEWSEVLAYLILTAD